MSLGVHIGILLGSGLILSTCAGLVVRAALGIAKRAGVSNFTVGFLLLGIVTSTPEIFVAIQSGISGIPQLATGNLLGGSILILSLVMGLLAFINGKVTLDRGFRWQDMMSTCAVIAAPVFVLWDGALSRGEGIFLIGAYVIHGILVVRDGHVKKPLSTGHKWRGASHTIWLLVVGIGGLAISSRVIVTSAEVIISSLGISPIIFGLFFLSLGTNLPEFALAVRSLGAKREDVAIGDFLGSSAANTLILGVLGVFWPYGGTDPTKVAPALVLLLCVTAFFLWSFSTGRTLTRKEGLGLLLFYALFVLYELFS